MTKGRSLIVRVEGEEKGRITAAAQREGKSVTAFVLHATMRAVERTESAKARPPAKPVRGGACPTFFGAACATAESGGASNYGNAGYSLAGALAGEGPYDLEAGAWEARLRELEALVASNTLHRTTEFYRDVTAWFVENLPRCMELVPARRRESFAKGVCKRIDEFGIDL